jgi:capsular polysaccharide biosynthesis protein
MADRVQPPESPSYPAGRDATTDDEVRELDQWNDLPSGPSPGVWDAVRASPLLVAATVVIVTALAVAAGVVRQQKYTATARIGVLHVDFASPGALSGFATSAATLADTYARSVDANGVVNPLAVKFRSSPSTIREQLSGAGIPASPIFTISATTTSPVRSVALANAAAAQLAAYIRKVNLSNPDATRLYLELVKAEDQAAITLVTKQGLQSSARAAATAARGPVSPLSATQRAQIALATAHASAAEDRVNSLRAAYQQSVVGASQTQFMQPLESAFAASSDRNSKLALFAFAGLAVGLGLGVALAVLRQARRRIAPSA